MLGSPGMGFLTPTCKSVRKDNDRANCLKCGAMFCGSSRLIAAGNQCHPQTAEVL